MTVFFAAERPIPPGLRFAARINERLFGRGIENFDGYGIIEK